VVKARLNLDISAAMERFKVEQGLP